MASGEGLTAMRDEEKALVALCCSVSMSAHRSPSSHFLLRTVSHPFPSAVFAFPASWSVDDWILAGEWGGPFGESEIDACLFPSLRSVGNDVAARVNRAFLRSFQRLLKDSRLQAEVHRALAEKKRIVFTGHSSGGSVSVLAAIWLLEQFFKSDNKDQVFPFCVTFGSPLVGDRVFSHALQRQDWSCCFLHFVSTVDVIPRSLLAPLSSFKQEFQAILHFLCPKSLCFSLNTIGEPLVIFFYSTVLRNALSISCHRACLSMGCTNPLLEVIPGFVKLSPYRPFGTYVFCSDNGLVSLKNPDAILQVLCYSFQLTSKEDLSEVAYRCLEEHLLYEPKIKKCLAMQDVVSMDGLEVIPLCLNDGISDEMQSIETMLEDLQLSVEARLCLRAAGEWENQRLRNQAKIDANYSKIQEALRSLSDYRATCEIRGLGYYDTFKLQKDKEDFDANVRRLELAGLWDEIVEMLRRYELPDNFEGRTDWVDLGTSYRCLVEPLDIANYYRHAKNEDTGPYMVKGRPRRYKYTQRWLEQAHRMPAWSSMESCFWAVVEELCIDSSSSSRPFEEMKDKVLELEKEASMWLSSGKLGKDVLLEESTFVKWWKTLPIQHRLGSCISSFMNGENMAGR
ncbi:protein EDS1B [Elaeis guineensis]|uniref:Protein EDS1B n=1 Tax=Elaeis guineensis var. tenera TaxID=51953 RepID=A0A6I9SET9_ELAGV|nr:protein EDS1B [Elaeis guineensis]